MKITNEAVLEAARKRPCEYCRKPPRSQAAHYFTKGMGGGQQLDVAENVLGLCVLCHARHHNGKEPTPETCVQIIAQREGYTADAIKAYLWILQAAYKGSIVPTIREFTGKPPCPVHPRDPVFAHPIRPRY